MGPRRPVQRFWMQRGSCVNLTEVEKLIFGVDLNCMHTYNYYTLFLSVSWSGSECQWCHSTVHFLRQRALLCCAEQDDQSFRSILSNTRAWMTSERLEWLYIVIKPCTGSVRDTCLFITLVFTSNFYFVCWSTHVSCPSLDPMMYLQRVSFSSTLVVG